MPLLPSAQLTGAVAAARRGAEEALEGYREQVARQLREAAVTADNKLASTKHRMAAVDTLLSDVQVTPRDLPLPTCLEMLFLHSVMCCSQAVASRAEAAAAVASGRLEKVLLEHGEHTMRVAGLEQAHTQVPLPHCAPRWPLTRSPSRVPRHITLITSP